jgi:hypothetical protein
MHTESAQLRALARQVGQLKPTSATEVSLVRLMAGAIYSLLAAADLGYDDSRVVPAIAPFAAEFRQTLDAIERGVQPPPDWIAGLHFHSGLMRLDAVDTRVASVLGRKPAHGSRVRNAVNSLKHDEDAHLSGKHPLTFKDAVVAAERMVIMLQQAIP